LQVVHEFFQVELGSEQCVFQHFDALCVRVEAAKFLETVAELHFLQHLHHQVYAG
jgi:hypothetical protein